MGLDVNRVHGDVDEELLCPICSGVLVDPLAAPECEHAFCQPCITQWLARRPTCPVDRQPVQVAELRPVPRILKNLLARLEVTCDNAASGCQVVVKLDLLSHHLKECEHNPKKAVVCERGCGLAVPKDELAEHNCVRELRGMVARHEERIAELQTELGDCKYQIVEQRRDVNILKDVLRTARIGGGHPALATVGSAGVGGGGAASGGGVAAAVTGAGQDGAVGGVGAGAAVSAGGAARTVTDQIQNDEVSRWASTLQVARVSRWGGMISTPDASLQMAIKRALVESTCPDHIVNELMANAHERRWPTGLLTLETRQMNRRQYEQYVCRRIPNKQAVAVMACDNAHMSDDMILEPGLVMIFAHGIE